MDNRAKIITEIHESDIFGVFVEMGCGVALSNALMEVSGATKTVYVTEAPYSREYQHENYHNEGMRAVSKESVDAVLEGWRDKINEARVNTIYVASFQLGENGSTHGWIGLLYKGTKKFYHVSIHAKMTRKEYLGTIADIGVKIVRSKNEQLPADARIDIVEGESAENMFDMIARSKGEQFLCIRDGQFVRMEDLFRDKPEVLIYKGSFNPPHIAHEEIARLAEEKYGHKPVMMISQEIYQKGIVSHADMTSRVATLNALGFDVVVSKSGFFNQNISYIQQKFEQPIVFIVGTDTLNRIFESTYPIIGEHTPAHVDSMVDIFLYEFNNVASFFVVERNGFPLHPTIVDRIDKKFYVLVPSTYDVSSTQIREMLSNNNNEEAKKLIPNKIHKNFDNK